MWLPRFIRNYLRNREADRAVAYRYEVSVRLKDGGVERYTILATQTPRQIYWMELSEENVEKVEYIYKLPNQ